MLIYNLFWNCLIIWNQFSNCDYICYDRNRVFCYLLSRWSLIVSNTNLCLFQLNLPICQLRRTDSLIARDTFSLSFVSVCNVLFNLRFACKHVLQKNRVHLHLSSTHPCMHSSTHIHDEAAKNSLQKKNKKRKQEKKWGVSFKCLAEQTGVSDRNYSIA